MVDLLMVTTLVAEVLSLNDDLRLIEERYSWIDTIETRPVSFWPSISHVLVLCFAVWSKLKLICRIQLNCPLRTLFVKTRPMNWFYHNLPSEAKRRIPFLTTIRDLEAGCTVSVWLIDESGNKTLNITFSVSPEFLQWLVDFRPNVVIFIFWNFNLALKRPWTSMLLLLWLCD